MIMRSARVVLPRRSIETMSSALASSRLVSMVCARMAGVLLRGPGRAGGSGDSGRFVVGRECQRHGPPFDAGPHDMSRGRFIAKHEPGDENRDMTKPVRPPTARAQTGGRRAGSRSRTGSSAAHAGKMNAGGRRWAKARRNGLRRPETASRPRRRGCERAQGRARPIDDRDRGPVGDLPPAPPQMELAQIVRPHDPDEMRRRARGARSQAMRIVGEARADLRLEAGDGDARIVGHRARGCDARVQARQRRRSVSAGCRG